MALRPIMLARMIYAYTVLGKLVCLLLSRLLLYTNISFLD